MDNQLKPSIALHVSLWVVQVLLAFLLMLGAIMKFMPVEKVAPIMPWMGQVPEWVLRLLGMVDLLGAVGLILPALLRIKPLLTPIAALGIIVLMICASIFHVSRGEASKIGFNIFMIAMAAFIAWGRFRKAPIAAQ